MSEELISERWSHRIGGWLLIVGALLGMVGNLVHPQTPIGRSEGIGDLLALAIAESRFWVPIHIAIVFGLTLMLPGFVALNNSLRDGLATALARFGFAFAIAGITIGMILVTLDGLVAPQLARSWAMANAQERPLALLLVLADQTMNFALASLFNIVFAGFTFIFYGLAVSFSSTYPRGLGSIVVVAGFGSIGAGLVQAYYGESTQLSWTLTIIFPTIITLWLLVVGILLVRKGRSYESDAGL